jgi:hypothetical protein
MDEWRLACILVATAWLSSACGGNQERDPETTTSAITTLGSTDTDVPADADDGGPKLDVADNATGGEGGGEGGDSGCKKVDLLFVIDNSGSMEDEQANLIASFPGFIDAMRTTLDDTNGYNIGVTTSDLYFGDIGDFTCLQDGALVTRTNGNGASNRACGPYASGKRFMTEADDLADTFACAAQVGISGEGNERPMATAQAAVSNGMVGPGGCNEGFLRDDALLVLVFITDEEDDHEIDGCDQLPQDGSPGEPEQWFDGIVAAKDGNEASIVVLSLVGPRDGQQCPALDKCDGGIEGAEVADRIIDFTERFTHGFVGSVCEPYGPFFEEAISVIQSACNEFVPQG